MLYIQIISFRVKLFFGCERTDLIIMINVSKAENISDFKKIHQIVDFKFRKVM